VVNTIINSELNLLISSDLASWMSCSMIRRGSVSLALIISSKDQARSAPSKVTVKRMSFPLSGRLLGGRADGEQGGQNEE